MKENAVPTEHICTRHVRALPMTRLEYNQLRGWEVPANENGNDAGYRIEDINGESNHPQFSGYLSWMPVAEFNRTCTAAPPAAPAPIPLPPTDAEGTTTGTVTTKYPEVYNKNMTFGGAIESLKQGKRVARLGWNGRGMYLVLIGSGTTAHPLVEDWMSVERLPSLGMWTTNAHGRRAFLIGWLASQTDMLAEDWVEV